MLISKTHLDGKTVTSVRELGLISREYHALIGRKRIMTRQFSEHKIGHFAANWLLRLPTGLITGYDAIPDGIVENGFIS
jgi:hypothetical protein